MEWTKINVDHSLSRCSSRAAIGGVARGPNDDWLFSFKMSFRQVELESDNALLIEILQTGLASVSHVVEIQLIHNSYLKDWRVKYKSIQRTNNKVADYLAKMTSSDIEHFAVLEELVHEIKTLLEEDTRSNILEESISN
ncbi:hypothetical protein Goari_002198 [Gossypium aridum]|uniref:RNase H type-1 domain-containing protein n=2 Tax=Gossypium aridum TaxID=34290 RepID=A0A7J8Y8G5_GOSAI|nr:hypothetical protein [Gossypium aridum]